jgi:hypothetical protein
MRRKLTVWIGLFVAGFLFGYILQYTTLHRVQGELTASTNQLGSCRREEQSSHLRDTATRMYLEVAQRNYGKAGEYSKNFFDEAQRIASSTDDPILRKLLVDTLATRDQITADLAKGDGGVVSEVQSVLIKLEQNATHLTR